ncbi:hypothetical protein M0Q97_07855 [Candidatus Dojkabacteria bacterium]|jgi:hypothetical protein|nr:hypothetical protein [Candidatus Dojkabacteria bacterium]
MKIATHILFFNQDNWILKNIEMIGPYVDKIYVAWSEFPWSYNSKARENFKNRSNIELLKQSKYYNKIVLIKGDWKLDEDQRNSCLNEAKKDGMDFLLIIDADEFYKKEDLEKLILDIKNNPDYEYYTTPWFTYWKDFNHIIVNKENSIICGYPEVCVNLKYNNKFIRCRKPSGTKIKQLTSICGHASYVLTNEECWSKINTWGHAHQFDSKKWYNDKWLLWNENTIDLHPINPSSWYKTIKTPENLNLNI